MINTPIIQAQLPNGPLDNNIITANKTIRRNTTNKNSKIFILKNMKD